MAPEGHLRLASSLHIHMDMMAFCKYSMTTYPEQGDNRRYIKLTMNSWFFQDYKALTRMGYFGIWYFDWKTVLSPTVKAQQ